MNYFLKQTLFRALVVMLSFSATVAHAQTAQLTDAEQTWVDQNPVIRVHNELNWPPFNFNLDGQATGYSVGYMNLVAAAVGLEVEYISGPSWDQFLDMMRNDELDVMLNIVETPARLEYLTFTEPYAITSPVLAIQEQSDDISSLQEIGQRQLCIPEGSSTQEFLQREYPELNLLALADALSCLHAVLDGRAYASLDGYSVLQYLLSENVLPGLRISNVQVDTAAASIMRIATNSDSTILRDTLQKGMDSVDQEQLSQLRAQWLGAGINSDSQTARLQLNQEELDWIAENPVIRVHNDPDWAPFNFYEDEQPKGLSIDYMNRLAEKIGIQIEYVSGPVWLEFFEMIQSGELDVMLNITETSERAEFLNFTESYMQAPVAVWVKDATSGIQSLEDLNGIRMAVPEGYFTAEILARDYPEIELVFENSTLNALYAVVEGRADAILADLPVIDYLVNQNSITGLQIAFVVRDPSLVATQHLGVRKDLPLLRDILQKAMDALTPQEFAELTQKWLVQSPQAEAEDSLSSTIYLLLGATLSLFLILVIFNRISSRFSQGSEIGLQTGTLRFRILILGSISGFVALTAILGWLALDYIKERVLQDVENNLVNALVTTEQRLAVWAEQQANVLSQIVRNPELIERAELLLDVESSPQSLLASDELAAVRATLDEYQDVLGLGFFIIDKEGVSLASRRDNNVGTENLIAIQSPQILDRVFQGESVFVPPIYSDLENTGNSITNDSSLFIAVPITNATGVFAALTMRLDPTQGFSRVLQFSRVGESGESYAFDSEGILVSASRFEDDLRNIGLLGIEQSSVMNIQIRDPGGDMTEGFLPDTPRSQQMFTHMAASAFSNIGVPDLVGSAFEGGNLSVETGMEGYRDYRGVPVYGAWFWNNNLGLGLTSEIDVAEALATFYTIRMLFFIVFGVTLLLSLGGTFFVLATGERTNRVLLRAKDELEDRVKERTRELSKANEQTNLILQNATEGILTIDDDQILVRFNPACEDMWGYKAEEVLGREMTMLIPEYARESHLDNVHRFRDAETSGVHMESRGLKLFGLTKSGEVFPTEVGVSKNVVNGITYYSAFIRDITEREKSESKILEAMEVAESATKAKGDFLANMSHEIRTPMNAVIGLSDLCLRTDLNPKQEDYLSKIHGSAESLLGIINDILDFSKIEAGQLNFEEIDFELDELLENLATVAHVKIQEKGLEFLFNRDPNIPSVLNGDPLRLNQILINLTNNSVKFTDEGEIVVTIELVEKSAESIVLRFSVRDTGIGMSKEQQGRLFQSFSQADSSITRKYGGTGLGLSISKQLVELMKGEIGVESEPGVGSNFIFTATLGIGSAAEIKSYDVVPNLKNMRAIVVDDNPTAQEILSTYLRHFTFEVDVANNADELFKMMSENSQHYDLILLDWLMPGMNGLETAEKIKTEIKPEVDPHIIMVSAFNAGDVAGKAGGEYIDQFLSKPVSPSHLFDAIMMAFGVATDSTRRKQGGQKFDLATLRPVQGATILLVEDNEINQQVASETLEQAGFYVDIANHGLEALEMLEGKQYDCVLMDLQMPIMDGFTATAKIRENPAYKELPILAMTANATAEDRDRSLAAGMNEHIAKPIRPQLLFKALVEWIPHGERELPESFGSETGPETEPTLPELSGIDVEGGLERMGGSAKSYIKLLDKFSENQVAAVSEIREALASNDQELAERLAHTLKGVSGSIGATELFDSATELESAIKQQIDDQVEELLSKV